jgi:hypothetical protein
MHPNWRQKNMLKTRLPVTRVIASLTSALLLFTAIVPSIAAAVECGCPQMAANPSPLQFGLITINTPSPQRKVSFTPSVNVKLGNVTLLTEPTTIFTIGTLNQCKNATIAAGHKCEVGVIFKPEAMTEYTNFLEVQTENEQTMCTINSSVLMTGTGK